MGTENITYHQTRNRAAQTDLRATSAFSAWTQGRSVPSMGTNSGAAVLAFQEWRHFKEAFAPELVARAVDEDPNPVVQCLDPFGGSGTTAIACQFLGIKPVTIEVNPYLADLIEAKLTTYNADKLIHDLGVILRRASQLQSEAPPILPLNAPPTLLEPGVKGRWVFDKGVERRVAALLSSISHLEDISHQRLFKVLLGGILLQVSNVVVNGKGRRYRKRWRERRRPPKAVDHLFSKSARRAILDIHKFGQRPCLEKAVLRGDARQRIYDAPPVDLAVFSPPYPNSFDYTDVYNLELWVLGYLSDKQDNRDLRQSTLCSHVQIDRAYPAPPAGSSTLNRTLLEVRERSNELWHKRIPEMLGGYFSDLTSVLTAIHAVIRKEGRVWLVVGDSRYAGVTIPTAQILTELAPEYGYQTLSLEPFRSMRSSAQQGGKHQLEESLVVLASRGPS